MPSSARTFRVFVSSTFSDLKEERDALQKRVFPKLRELCMQHGCRFQAIDLRWGVREEAGLDQQTLKICIEEIKRCQRTKLKPNFIVLLGDRYGWRPAPPEIPKNEFDEIKRHLSKEEIEQLNKWYLLDGNAVPAVYCLQSRTGEYRLQENWEVVEAQLRSILLKGIAEVKLSEKQLVKYFESATEQEINQGLDDPEPQKHVFCFFRKIEGIEENARKGFVDLDKTGGLDNDAYNRLNTLKNKLQMRLQHNCFCYEAGLTSEGVTKDYIDKLCDDVYDSLAQVIREEIKKISEVDSLDKEVDDHTVFEEERARFFVGREAVLESIKNYLGSGTHQPLAVFGESGSGKTSLMAYAVKESCKSFPDSEIVFRFIGVTPSSTDGRSLLESICRQITRRYKEDESTVPSEYPKLAADFSARLKLATSHKPLFIFLDALDQLSSINNAQNLSWLPSVLPKHVHMVVSCLPSECASILEKKLPPQNVVLVKAMSRDDGEALLKNLLANANRCLRFDQEKEVLDKFNVCGMPLYLKLAFEEARQWKSFTEKKELRPTISGIILEMFNRLSSNENYGEKMFSHILGYLAASKNGLTEDELLDVISLDAEVFEDFKKSSFHELTGDRLPVVVWARLYFDLEPYLTERSADNTSLLGFYHRQLNEVVVHEYLKEDIKAVRHGLLGHYFNGDFDGYPQPLQLQVKGKTVYNMRKLSELPYQETFGELWLQLEHTLTDLAFIEAKCASGMTYNLVDDYKMAMGALPEGQEEKRKELQNEEQVRRYSQHLIAFARGEISSLDIIHSIEIWSKQKIEEATNEIICNPTRLDYIRAFSRFVNSEGYALVKFASFPKFCLQQAYNFTRSGPVGKAAEKLVQLDTEHIMLLHENFQRPEYDPFPALIGTLEGHKSEVNAVCCTPDGKLAVSGGSDRTLRVWDLQSGKCKKKLTKCHNDEICCVCCTPDGSLAISASRDGTLKVWNLENWKCKWVLTRHKGYVNSVCCTSDGKLAIFPGSHSALNTLDLKNGENKEIGKRGKFEYVTSVCCTPDGKSAVSSGWDGEVKVWDLLSRELKKTLMGHTRTVESVCCTPDGKLAISAGGDDTERVGPNGKMRERYKGHDAVLKVWNLDTGECIRTLTGHADIIHSVCCTPDGRLAISASEDGTLKLWNVQSGKCRKTIVGHTTQVRSVCCTPNGKVAFSESSSDILKVWNTQTGEYKKELITENRESWGICCSPDGRLVISASRNWAYSQSEDSTLNMWDLQSGDWKNKQTSHIDKVSGICCTPDGKLAISAKGDKMFKLGPDGTTVRCRDYGGALMIMDLETGECQRTLTGHIYEPFGLDTGICCTPDGRLVISSGSFATLKIWDLYNGKWKKILKGHTDQVTSVCCTPDGKLAISASEDGTLKLWDLESLKCKKTLTGHSALVYSVCCTPDGRLAISASGDGTLRVWDIKTELPLAVYQARSYPTAVALIAGSPGHLIYGGFLGEVIFIRSRNLPAEPPLLTPVRLWLHEINGKKGRWEKDIMATCTWCGQRFAIEPQVIEKIEKLSSIREDSTAAETREFKAQVNLDSSCPCCNKPIRFNPFIVDNKKSG